MDDNGIDKQLASIDGEDTTEDVEIVPRIFQMYPNSRIPVSKALGSFWHQRQKECWSAYEQKNYKERWAEAIRYYQHDQSDKSTKDNQGNLSRTRSGRMTATENIVFANVSALIPSTYAKNPDIEITANSSTDATTHKQEEARAKMYEKLLDALFARKAAPGLNIKPKMKRLTVLTTLTNIAYLELGYTRKQDSSEEVFAEIEALSTELLNASDSSEIAAIEGKLQALEEKINFLNASGPTLKVREPMYVLRDPSIDDADISNDNYIIIGDMVRTDYLRAMYYQKDKDSDEYKSLFDHTHVASATGGGKNIAGHDEDMQTFTLLDAEPDFKQYGYTSESEFKSACRTLVWYVWDKTTRRIYMFHNDNWKWPIWVWDDPYHLTRFFPIFPMTFYTDPVDPFGRSEVVYYLDQQDEINKVNDERARMRHWASSKIFVNTELIPDVTQIENFLNGTGSKKVHGLKLPEGSSIANAIGTMALPSTQFEQLFETRSLFESVNRVSSVTPVLQNVQFKTNTTNRAIESYESSTQGRLDEKIDAIEEVLADVGLALLEMCVQFMTEDEVIRLIGRDVVQEAGGWRQIEDPAQLYQLYNFRIVGGSTLKPTSKVKKEQAVQLGQVMGQFASASPVVLVFLLRMFERAFNDEFVVTDADWKMVMESIEQAAGIGASPMQQVDQILAQLPPELQQQIGSAIAGGAPISEVMAQVEQMSSGGAPEQPQPQPQPQPNQPAQ
jgi:hypothetical protein